MRLCGRSKAKTPAKRAPVAEICPSVPVPGLVEEEARRAPPSLLPEAEAGKEPTGTPRSSNGRSSSADGETPVAETALVVVPKGSNSIHGQAPPARNDSATTSCAGYTDADFLSRRSTLQPDADNGAKASAHAIAARRDGAHSQEPLLAIKDGDLQQDQSEGSRFPKAGEEGQSTTALAIPAQHIKGVAARESAANVQEGRDEERERMTKEAQEERLGLAMNEDDVMERQMKREDEERKKLMEAKKQKRQREMNIEDQQRQRQMDEQDQHRQRQMDREEQERRRQMDREDQERERQMIREDQEREKQMDREDQERERQRGEYDQERETRLNKEDEEKRTSAKSAEGRDTVSHSHPNGLASRVQETFSTVKQSFSRGYESLRSVNLGDGSRRAPSGVVHELQQAEQCVCGVLNDITELGERAMPCLLGEHADEETEVVHERPSPSITMIVNTPAGPYVRHIPDALLGDAVSMGFISEEEVIKQRSEWEQNFGPIPIEYTPAVSFAQQQAKA
ncbi:hypothetical protein ACSSS7_006559 [Eimeria intestinalis]